MTFTLYDVTVPIFLQQLGALRGVLTKGRDHAKATGVDPDALAEARLIDDMFPLCLQVQRVTDHSRGALEDASKGAFTVLKRDPLSYATLEQMLADAETAVRGYTPDAVNALYGQEFVFDTGHNNRRVLTAEAHLRTFSLPNFHFHAVTAYNILRSRGVPIGKGDYLKRG